MTRIEIPSSGGRRRARGGIGRWLSILLVLVIGGGAFWTWLTLHWAYAEGERAGILQKFVRRGWVCKTREGEIALYYGGGPYMGAGTSPQLWDFSVRDDAVAAELNKAVGHRVQLHYTEHPGVPTACFAETRYYVDHVTVADPDQQSPVDGARSDMPLPAAPATPRSDSQAGGTLPAPPPPPVNPAAPNP